MATNEDVITSTIRTAVPSAVGFGLAKLVAAIPAVGEGIGWVNDQLAEAGFAGYTVDFIVTTGAVAGAITGYYWIARKVGAKYPLVEKWLLGSSKTPTYTTES